MRVQDYAPPKLTLGIVGVIAVIIPVLVGYFLVSGMATSSGYTSVFNPATSTTSTTSSGPGTSVAVSIPSGAGSPNGAPGYAPATLTVVLGTNASVTWTNNDSAHHTVTSSSTPAGASSFNSGDLAPGATFTYNFTTAGTYSYICNYHAWMKGTVVVVGGSASSGVAVSIPSGAGSPSGAPGYSPDKITLVVGANNTVTWTNNDSAHHTVTSSSVPSGATSFNSGDLAPGATYSYTFTTPGTYTYICNYHTWMTATVTVVAGK